MKIEIESVGEGYKVEWKAKDDTSGHEVFVERRKLINYLAHILQEKDGK